LLENSAKMPSMLLPLELDSRKELRTCSLTPKIRVNPYVKRATVSYNFIVSIDKLFKGIHGVTLATQKETP
jgi:hypothetical protein